MNELAARRLLLLTFLAALITITYYDLKGQGTIVKQSSAGGFTIGKTGQLPNPREFLSAGVVFTLLGALAVASPPLAAVLGAGTLLGIATSRASKAKAPTTGGGSLAGTFDLGTTAPLSVLSPGTAADGSVDGFTNAPPPLVAPAPGQSGPNRFG